jgi:hypothetical protein
MERGYVIAQPAIQAGFWPSTIGWLSPSDGPTGRGVRDQAFAQPLVQIGIFSWAPVPRFPAWRCAHCKRVEFTYGDAILKVRPEDEPQRPREVREGSDFEA